MTRARDVANVLSAASILATDTETAAAISTHNSATTAVHGISNTSLLATQEYVQNNKGVGKGNTASRPASPSIGDLYYNTELKDLEQYTEDGWLIVAKQPPRIPAIGSATLDGSNNASVSFTPSTYGQTASSFTVQSNPGSYTATASSSPISISGANLQVGTGYTFRVKSTGSYGDSAYSAYTSSAVTPVILGSYESIQTVTVASGGTASISFTSIPQTYTHLQVRMLGKTPAADNGSGIYLALNGTGLSYSHRLTGFRGGAGIDAQSGVNDIICYFPCTASGVDNMFGAAILDIIDYKNTNKVKTTRTSWGYSNNGVAAGSEFLGMHSGLWNSTAAINSITLTAQSSRVFSEYSSFALYGIKA